MNRLSKEEAARVTGKGTGTLPPPPPPPEGQAQIVPLLPDE